MPRERKLTIEEAIEKSMFAFLEHGFGLVVRSLKQITGINRFMLQSELGGKEGLFLQAFDAYLAEAEKVIYLPIASGDLKDIVQVFQKLFNDDKTYWLVIVVMRRIL